MIVSHKLVLIFLPFVILGIGMTAYYLRRRP